MGAIGGLDLPRVCFRYVDGLPEESVSSALVFGTGIHTAIEQYFQAILSGDPALDLDALLFAYRSAWLPHDPDAISSGVQKLGLRWMDWPRRLIPRPP